MKTIMKLWMLIILLIVITPLGLVIPERFKAGAAWGEWGSNEVRNLIGYIPRGLNKLASLWNAPMPDYTFKNWAGKGIQELSISYIISAIAGILIIAGIVYLIGKFLSKPR